MNQAGSDGMRALGIVQSPAPNLRVPTRFYDLPAESEVAMADLERLRTVADAVFDAHKTKKGLGVAAPQVGVDRRIAVVRPWGDEYIYLINPCVVEESAETDIKHEGCLSLFDVRGLVPRSLSMTVEFQDIEGRWQQAEFVNATARLIAHEIDHLDGILYVDRITGALVSIADYRRLPNTDWSYTDAD